MAQKKIVLGIDLGGTKISFGLISQNGEILGSPYTIPTRGTDPSEIIINRIFDSVEEVLGLHQKKISDISGIGIGATGPLDMQKGIILECPFLPTLNYFPLRDRIFERFKVPVYLDNDANCFALGECYFGAGSGNDVVLGYTLGTGLGCAIIIEKDILTGATQHAGEVWASPYRNETIEYFVSGRGISHIYSEFAGTDISALEIAQLAYDGEKSALQTWEQFGEHLAFALSWGINMVDPDIVILGGSIANAMDLFAPTMERFLRKYLCPVPSKKTRVVNAQLGNEAGLIGAGCLVLRTLPRH